MQITFLKAGSGDSILIHHRHRNVLVDGGNDSKYLLEQILLIHQRGELIDLLIITHHDDDHIKGIIDLLNKVVNGDYGDKTKFITRVIFNSPRLVLGKTPAHGDRLLSYKQAHEVENLLFEMNPQWEVCTEDSNDIIVEDMTLSFLSPNLEDIKEYSENSGAYLTSDYKCDWNSSMKTLNRYIDDKSQDTSLFNRSSIVLIVTCEGKRVLLTGDVTPNRLERIISKLEDSSEGKKVLFDYIKLPHHCSYRSINKRIFENIICKNFVISTNGKKHFLPNKRGILKVLKYLVRNEGDVVNFYFNYQEALNNMNIEERELIDYNFKLIPNNTPYGITI